MSNDEIDDLKIRIERLEKQVYDLLNVLIKFTTPK